MPELNQIPAGPPPPGQMPNLFDKPPSRQRVIIGVCVLFIVLTTSFVVVRVYVTKYITRAASAEDCTPLCEYSATTSLTYCRCLRIFGRKAAVASLWKSYVLMPDLQLLSFAYMGFLMHCKAPLPHGERRKS